MTGGAGQAIQWLLSQAPRGWGGGCGEENTQVARIWESLERDGPRSPLGIMGEASSQSMRRGLGRSED